MIVGDTIGKETDVDVSARCCVCGDSTTNKNKKRLHLYEKSGTTLVNCFNGDCDVHHNMWNFIKRTSPDLLDSYKRETFGEKLDNYINRDKEPTPNKALEKLEDPITYHDLTSYFTPIEESQKALDYIKSRGLPYKDTFGKWYYGSTDLIIGDKKYSLNDSVIIPLYKDNKMYGFYSRKIENKFFATYNPEVNIGYKVWNWFNIDKSRPVYIFEGIFDAISIGKTNVVATMGADIPMERVSELSQPVFCLDNDKTGWMNSIKYAEMGHRVLIYPDDLHHKDMNKVLTEGINPEEIVDSNIYKGRLAIVKLRKKLGS
jgi:hypothetical protein